MDLNKKSVFGKFDVLDLVGAFWRVVLGVSEEILMDL